MASQRSETAGLLRVSGGKAEQFLQGQLSAEVRGLTPGEARACAALNFKGRVVACGWLLKDDQDFCLFGDYRALGILIGQEWEKFLPLYRGSLNLDLSKSDAELVREAGHARENMKIPLGYSHWIRLREGEGGLSDSLALLLIHRGIPWVTGQLSSVWLAQDLNLDLTGALDWEKGCYLGQEVVARLHYRGKPKRRMKRVSCGEPLNPGDRLLNSPGEEEAGRVVISRGGDSLVVLPLASESFLSPTRAEVNTMPLPYQL